MYVYSHISGSIKTENRISSLPASTSNTISMKTLLPGEFFYISNVGAVLPAEEKL